MGKRRGKTEEVRYRSKSTLRDGPSANTLIGDRHQPKVIYNIYNIYNTYNIYNIYVIQEHHEPIHGAGEEGGHQHGGGEEP